MIRDIKTYRMIKESVDNLADDIFIVSKNNPSMTLDPKEWVIDQVVDIISDPKEIRQYDNALEALGGSNVSTDLGVTNAKVGETLWITLLLKPRNASSAYPLGEMGCAKVKILQVYRGLNKLQQLKSQGKL